MERGGVLAVPEAAAVRVRIVDPAGREHRIEASPGETLMQAARLAAVPGIDAECGGNGACGTCHVYVEPPWLARLPAIGADERDLLAIAPHATTCSRLSCQLRLSHRLDGLEVRVPDRQR